MPPADLGLHLADLNATWTNLAMALLGGVREPQPTVSVVAHNQHLGMTPAVSRQSKDWWPGWSGPQIAEYLTWLARGEFLVAPRVNGDAVAALSR
jgi:hypothetical protein